MIFFWKKKHESSSPEPATPATEQIPGSGPAQSVGDSPSTAVEETTPSSSKIQNEALASPVQVESSATNEQAELESSEYTNTRPGFFGRLKTALSQRIRKTREEIVGQIKAAIKAAGKIDEDLLDRIEEILIRADVGAETTLKIIEEMREFEARGATADELIENFKQQLVKIVGDKKQCLVPPHETPWVILFVGVNGTGKTTTIGKLAAEFRAKGKRCLLVAGDTFRAAAIEQLSIWAQRTVSDFIAKEMGADPAGLAYDALNKAKAEGIDVVLIDTAGRLHTKKNLMEELKKIDRVIKKIMPTAPHDTLLVLDATTGQNAIQQAKVFTEAIPVTGLVMTKLDGTAKGGVLIGIRNTFALPVVKIGVGEGVEDLRDFDPKEFVEALFEEPENNA